MCTQYIVHYTLKLASVEYPSVHSHPSPLSLVAFHPGPMPPGMVNGDPNIQQPNIPYLGGVPEPGPGPASSVSATSSAAALTTVSGGAGGQFNPSNINSPHHPLSGGLDLAGPSSVGATGFSPRPISSVENKQTINKLLSPTSSSFSPSSSQNQGSSDPLAGIPSLPSIKNEPLTSPTFSSGPTSIPNPPQSQSIKAELNSVGGGDVSTTLNVSEVPLLESLSSVPNTHTPSAGEE